MSNFFSFNGRIRRTEYGISFIIYVAVYIFILIAGRGANGIPALNIIFIPLIWFLWAQGAKRCHDINKSGWWQIIPFYFLWLIFEKGDQRPNQYDNGGGEAFYGADDYEKPYTIENTTGPDISGTGDYIVSAENHPL